MAQNHTWHRLNFDVSHRCALGFRKFTNLVMRKFNIFHIARADLGDKRLNFILSQTEGGW